MMRTLLVISGFNFIVMLVAGWLMFIPVNLAEVYNEPFDVFPAEVQRGDTITFAVEFYKTDNYRVESTRAIICDDGNLVTLAVPNSTDGTVRSSVSQGRHTATVEITIPEKTSLGKCHVELNNTYYVNPLRTLYRTMETKDFTVYE